MLSPEEKKGISRFLTWVEDNQSKNSFDLSELLQFQQDFIAEEEADEG